LFDRVELDHLEEAVLSLDYVRFTLGPLGIGGKVRRVSEELDKVQEECEKLP
jgi:hypothetical protein